MFAVRGRDVRLFLISGLRTIVSLSFDSLLDCCFSVILVRVEHEACCLARLIVILLAILLFKFHLLGF